MEEWRKIVLEKHEGCRGGEYEVSSLGRVRKTAYEKERGGQTLIRGGDIMTQKVDMDGYHRVGLRNGLTQVGWRVHRLIALAFIPNPANKPTVDHINRDATDNRIENLRWATCAEQALNRRQRPPASGHANIRIVDRPSPYSVVIVRNRTIVFKKCFKTLPEAITARDAFLSSL